MVLYSCVKILLSLKGCAYLTEVLGLCCIFAAPCKNVSISACASEQCDQGHSCQQHRYYRAYFAHTQDDLNLHILCMFKGTFSLDAALLLLSPCYIVSTYAYTMSYTGSSWFIVSGTFSILNLIFTTLLDNSADNKLIIFFFLYFF